MAQIKAFMAWLKEEKNIGVRKFSKFPTETKDKLAEEFVFQRDKSLFKNTESEVRGEDK